MKSFDDPDQPHMHPKDTKKGVFVRIRSAKTTAGDVDLPCFGVFEMKDGKIKEWRHYFDMGTFMKAISQT